MKKDKKLFAIGLILMTIVIVCEVILHTVIRLDDYISRKLLVYLIVLIVGICLTIVVLLMFKKQKRGVCKRYSKLTLVAAVIIIIVYVVYHFIYGYRNTLEGRANSEIYDNIVNEYETGNRKLDLNDVVPFEWDVTYSIFYEVSEEEMKSNAGIHYNQIRRLPFWDYEISDNFSVLCFFKDDKLVFTGASYFNLYPENYEEYESYCYKIDKEDAKFSMIYDGFVLVHIE